MRHVDAGEAGLAASDVLLIACLSLRMLCARTHGAVASHAAVPSIQSMPTTHLRSWDWAIARTEGRAVRLDVEVLESLCGGLNVARVVLVSRHHIPK